MQPVDNDMDDLYRRAAEDYPLKTDAADWNKLLQKMEEGGVASAGEKKNSKARLLWLLLLLPMYFICNHYTNDKNSKSLGRESSEVTIDANIKQPDSKESTQLPKVDKTSSSQDETFGQKDDAGTNKQDVETSNVNDNKNLLVNKKGTGFNKTTTANSAEGGREDQSEVISTAIDGKPSGKKKQATKRSDKHALQKTADLSEALVQEQSSTEKNIKELTSASIANIDSANEEKKVTVDANTKKDDKEDSAAVKPTTKAKKAKKSVRDRKLYWGILAGPDLTAVRSSGVNGVGLSYGVVGGFQWNKNWAVETGVFWDKKDYKSDGESFKTDKAGWPMHTKVIDIAGYCKMFEVPITLRYNFSTSKNSRWFATAGASSYFMKSENYDYTVERYGMQYYGEKEYKNASSNWFSVVHMSIGYEKNIGRIGSLRLEPYLKLPVRGMGIGSLPLRSTGIYLGITRPIQ